MDIIQNGEGIALPVFQFLLAGLTRVQRRLANEGEVVVAARGIRDRGAAVGGDAERSRVGDGAAVHPNVAAPRVTNADGIAGVATAIDVADSDSAAVGGSRRDSAVTSRSGKSLHDVPPSLVPT